MHDPSPSSSRRTRAALLVGLGIDNFGSGLFLPLALLYAVRVVDVGLSQAGVVVGLATVVGFVVPPLAGRLNHRCGPLVSVVTAQVVQAGGAAAYLVANGPVGLFVAAAAMAAGLQLFYCSVFLLVADASDETVKERAFALVGMVRAATFGLGSLTAGLALAADDDQLLRWLVAVDGLTFVVGAVVLGRFVAAPVVAHTAPVTGPATVLRDRSYAGLMVVTCLMGVTVDVALVGTPVFGVDVLAGPGWLPGALLGAGTVLAACYGVRVVDLFAGRRRTDSLRWAAVAYVAFGSVFVGAVWVPVGWLVPWCVVGWLFLVVGNKIFFPFAAALSEALPPQAARSGYMATFQYSFTLAQVLAPGVVGLFAVARWLPWLALVGAAVLAGQLLGWLRGIVPAEADNAPRRPDPVAAETGHRP